MALDGHPFVRKGKFWSERKPLLVTSRDEQNSTGLMETVEYGWTFSIMGLDVCILDLFYVFSPPNRFGIFNVPLLYMYQKR